MVKHTWPKYVLTILGIPLFLIGAIAGFIWMGFMIGYEEMILKCNKIFNGNRS